MRNTNVNKKKGSFLRDMGFMIFPKKGIITHIYYNYTKKIFFWEYFAIVQNKY